MHYATRDVKDMVTWEYGWDSHMGLWDSKWVTAAYNGMGRKP